MKPETKKKILITTLSLAGLLVLIAIGILVFFFSQFAGYNDPTNHFSVKYPRAWRLVTQPQPGVAVGFISPKENALDLFQENVNISMQDVPDDKASIETFSDTITQQMTAVFKNNINIIANKPITFGDRIGHELVFDAPNPDAMTLKIAWVIKRGRAYIFTYAGKTNKNKELSQVIDEMIRSFHFN